MGVNEGSLQVIDIEVILMENCSRCCGCFFALRRAKVKKKGRQSLVVCREKLQTK